MSEGQIVYPPCPGRARAQAVAVCRDAIRAAVADNPGTNEEWLRGEVTKALAPPI